MNLSKLQHIAFSIEKGQNSLTKSLSIRLFLMDPSLNCIANPLSFDNERDLITRTPPQELPLIKALFQQEMLFRQKKSPLEREKELSSFTIGSQSSFTLLQKLASTGRLFFDKKKLICDFFNRTNLSIATDTTSCNNVRVTTSLILPSSCKLQACDLICFGLPNFIITKNFLRFLDDDISWQELDLLHKKEIFTHEEFNAIRKELAPSIILKMEEKHEHKINTITPALFLKDLHGTTANLMICYNDKYLAFHQDEIISKKPQEIRDIESEDLFENDLQEAGFKRKKLDNSSYFCPIISVKDTLDLLIGCGWMVFDYTGKAVKRITQLDYNFSNEDKIIINGKVSFGKIEEDLEQVISAIKKNKLFVPLKDGSCGLLSSPNLSLFQDLKDEIEIISGKKPTLKKNRIGLLPQQDREEIFNEPVNISKQQQFQGILRSYQEKGVSWLLNLYKNGFSGLLSDEMGLGKTVQALSFIAKTSPSKCLIVAPSSLIFNWRREIEKFLPETNFFVYSGTDRDIEKLYDPKNNIILTSYSILRGDIELIEKERFTFLFLDEAQAIKNMDTKTAQSMKRINASFRLSITGTPIENSYRELWSQFHFLMPDLLPTTYSEHLTSDEIKQIKRKVAPFILRRKKEEVASDLPEKIEQTIFVEMADEQKNLYLKFLASFKSGLIKKIDDGGSPSSFEVLEAILRLRQIVCHPHLVPQLIEDGSITSSKFELALSDIETLISEGKKIIFFSQFTSVLTLFIKEAEKKKFSYLRFDGNTKNREEVVDAFQNDPSISILFMSLKAGGVGLNLTKADAVMIYDPWWNLAQEEQAISRAHRIGKQGSLTVLRYIMKDTIEEKILSLQKEKQKISSSILDDNDLIHHLGLEELKELLS